MRHPKILRGGPRELSLPPETWMGYEVTFGNDAWHCIAPLGGVVTEESRSDGTHSTDNRQEKSGAA